MYRDIADDVYDGSEYVTGDRASTRDDQSMSLFINNCRQIQLRNIGDSA